MQSFLHASHARSFALRATLVIAAAVPVATVRAQSATPPTTPPIVHVMQFASDSSDATAADTATRRQSQMLRTVVVTASKPADEGLFARIARVDRERHDVVSRMVANHKLAAYVRWQGGEITRLETRLVYLTTTVTDSITRQIDAAEGEAAALRARRQELEAKLAGLESEQIARRTVDAPSADSALPAPRPLASGTR